MHRILGIRPLSVYGIFIGTLITMLLSLFVIYLHATYAQTTEVPTTTTPAAVDQQLNAVDAFYLPFVYNDFNPHLAKRIGYGATSFPITRYPDIRSLNAGWYVDWAVQVNPVTPAGMDYMQMIRLHQKIVTTNGCGIAKTPDRKECPYVKPYAYEYWPNAATIQAAAQANPGDTWIIGNEIDRLDWFDGSQDEMTPELYAVAYKELYDLIKSADPSAKVAIAGVIQATPMRLEYLTKIWNEYRRLYNVDMPVDIWNVHNFILAEICYYADGKDGTMVYTCPGAGSAAGSTQLIGSYVNQDWTHVDRTIFNQQIRAFRQWMKERGQEAKPLIVTEYGVLYSEIACPKPTANGCNDPKWVDLKNPQVVHDFMTWTFDYFLTERDCALSAVDDCHLVQQWLWFSLDHADNSTNPHTTFINRSTQQLLPAGEKFRQYTNEHYEALSRGY